ncbi:MAG: DUF2723 domain-containing protein [Cytophagales bacterium]|nr:DUF2723 domain-containing protein [Cytophagales bacterium]
MFHFKRTNNIVGWIVFAVSTLIYWLTVEPTASFWDCGEFIACSYKLEVPHPPGAPFFLLIGRLFSMLAGGDVSQVAYWINILSVLASGFTVLFLYWTIVLFARKILGIKHDSEISEAQGWGLLVAGAIGSLAYAFTDTAWFSAVEAEVYAMSSFFTALVVWAMLKWELIDDESLANRWLLFIAYMIGLSIGVHLLNLVTLPALGLIYYFKKYEFSWKGIFVTLLVSVVVLFFVNSFIIPGLPSWAGDIEIFFVNSLGLPFNSGIIFFILLLFIPLVFGIYYSQKNANELLNTALLAIAFILIGYSSYTIIPIRSAYNPPIDQNNPENVVSFVSYLKREQYGSRPLVYGQYFDAEITGLKKVGEIYARRGNKYVITDYKQEYEYDNSRKTLFPRIYSNSLPQHPEAYRNAIGLAPGEKPNFVDNIYFMFSDQIGRMYLRYFMWNFSGRESDIQGAGFLTPVSGLEKKPDVLKNNKARNNYYMLPLILGIAGLVFCYSKDKKVFGIIGMLFIMMGVALVVYLNMPPIEPRERDYIYVGSFYAFAIWIGLGVLALIQGLRERGMKEITSAALAGVLTLTVPGILLAENYDDHDRSDRYYSVDSAKNFLDSCEPNAIIFTGGDNDTFPLWYVQEVEGYRTDVRVIVLSYFNTDWYIHQMMRSAYDSKPLPFSFTAEEVLQGGDFDQVAYYETPSMKNQHIDAKQYIRLLRKKNSSLFSKTRDGGRIAITPSKNMFYKVDSAQVARLNIIPEKLKPYQVSNITWTMKKNYLEKNALMIIDLITNNNWERPIYFNHTSMATLGFDLRPYCVQEGSAYRLLPVKNPNPRAEFVNTDVMYSNLMNKFHHRGLDNPKVYYNENYRNFVQNARSNFNSLAQALIMENEPGKAKEVVDASLNWIPGTVIPFDFTASRTVSSLLLLKEKEKALKIARDVAKDNDEMLDYYTKKNYPITQEVQRSMYTLYDLSRTLRTHKATQQADSVHALLNKHNKTFRMF